MNANLQTQSAVMMECPICMDDIMADQNCTVTECGHTFHTSCLMTSVAHIGFGCPYCRTVMAEQAEHPIEDYDDDSIEDDLYDDFILRGFRFFMNNVSEQNHSAEDIQDEEDDEEDEAEAAANEDLDVKPTIESVTQLLVQQVPIETMVKAFLSFHREYNESDETFERCESEVFGKIRRIISQFQRRQPNV